MYWLIFQEWFCVFVAGVEEEFGLYSAFWGSYLKCLKVVSVEVKFIGSLKFVFLDLT